MKRNFVNLIVVAILLIFATIACKKEISVTQVKLSSTKLILLVDKTATLTATVLPEDATNKGVRWSSSNPSVATVTDGVITTIAVGQTTIKAISEDTNYSANCIVKVVSQMLEPDMVFVEGGSFTMGCTDDECLNLELPCHQVTLKDFRISKFLVTQKMWEFYMDYNLSKFKDNDLLPVEQVSWNDAQMFIRNLNASTGKNYRLPTESEWEYGARGGKFSFGFKYSGSNCIDDVAWYAGNSNNKTHPVGEKAPNELGIFDMSGNVWEWCSDWFGDYLADPQNNPTGPAQGEYRVVRGGHWDIGAQRCRISSRHIGKPGNNDDFIGLRLVLPID